MGGRWCRKFGCCRSMVGGVGSLVVVGRCRWCKKFDCGNSVIGGAASLVVVAQL